MGSILLVILTAVTTFAIINYGPQMWVYFTTKVMHH